MQEATRLPPCSGFRECGDAMWLQQIFQVLLLDWAQQQSIILKTGWVEASTDKHRRSKALQQTGFHFRSKFVTAK